MDFHDGILQKYSVDFQNQTAEILLSGYSNSNSKSRIDFKLMFHEVNYFSFTVDANELGRHRFAGNIVYLRIDDNDGTAKLFLTGGALLVRAISHSI